MDQMVYSDNCSMAISGILYGSRDGTAVGYLQLLYIVFGLHFRTVQHDETTKERWITDHTDPYRMTDMVSNGKVYKFLR